MPTIATTIQTRSGRHVELLAPSVCDIDWYDICHALARICRFTGHTSRIYSVAEHSMLVAYLVEATPQAVPYALIHDAHEAYINDLSSPLKQAIKEIDPAAWKAIKAIQEGFDIAIHAAAGLTYPVPPKIAKLIKEADYTALLIESRDLMPHQVRNPDNFTVPVVKVAKTNPGNISKTLMRHLEVFLPRFERKEPAA
jgi:hypothetical protein